MIDLTFNNFVRSKKYTRKFFERIINTSIKELGLKPNLGLSINLVGLAKIKFLNKRHRSKNTATDVLSFPVQSSVINKILDVNKKSRDILELGDIFICLEVAKKKVIESGHTLDKEASFLVVHGILHLLGYDHEQSKKMKQEMFRLQDKILKKLMANSG